MCVKIQLILRQLVSPSLKTERINVNDRLLNFGTDFIVNWKGKCLAYVPFRDRNLELGIFVSRGPTGVNRTPPPKRMLSIFLDVDTHCFLRDRFFFETFDKKTSFHTTFISRRLS